MTKNKGKLIESEKFEALIADVNNFIEGKIESVSKLVRENPQFFNKIYNQELCKLILEDVVSDNPDLPFVKFIELAMVLDDDLLVKILKKKPELIEKIEDHGKILNIAIELKSTETFKILINKGFNPQKKDKNTLSIFALAAQNQGADYLEKYAEILPKETVKSLILEQDQNGKDALSHAIEGRSYAKTIEFLLNNNANIEHRFKENLETAIIKKHNQTLEILLKNNPKGFAPESILDLSNFAKEKQSHLAQFFLKDLVENNSETQKLIKQNIAEIPAYQNTDIHEICREGNLKNFIDFANSFGKKQNISQLINTFDHERKTPLFYALEGNCYSDLVENLIDFGADPNFLRKNCEPHKANDALTLCVQKKEPKTLGVILKTKKAEITPKSLYNCAKALYDRENLNALTTKSFFENVKPKDLIKIQSEFYFEELVTNGMKFAPTETSKKIKKSLAEGLDPEKINEALYKAIQKSSSKIVENFLQNFDKVNSKKSPSSKKYSQIEDDDNEGSLLIELNHSPHKSYGSSSSKINLNKKTKDSNKPKLILDFDRFFDVAINKLERSRSPESKEVLIQLLKAGIETSDKDKMKSIKQLGIKKEDYGPSKSCYAVFCSAISSVFLSNNER